MTLTCQGHHKNAWSHNCMQQLVADNWARGMIAANLYCYIPGSSFMSPRRLSQISESGILKEKHAVAILSEMARMLIYTGR